MKTEQKDRRGRASRLFRAVSGLFVSVFCRSKIEPSVEDFRKVEFKTSTQRFGMRFTEKMRDVLRLKWLRKL